MHRFLRTIRALVPRLLLLTVSSLLGLGLLELAVRLGAPQQLITLRPDMWQPADDGVGWRHTPNAATTINTGERTARWHTDARGFRIPDDPVTTKAAWHVLAIGDSFVEAIQVDYADTMTAQLESALSRPWEKPGRIINAGVGGYDPNHYRLVATAELAAGRYRAALVFVYLGNDIVPKVRERYERRPMAARRALRWPRNLRPAEWVSAVGYPINDFLERRAHVFVLAKNRAKFLLMRVGLSAHYLPSTLQVSSADSPAWDVTAGILEDITLVAASHDTPVLFVLLPAVTQIEEAASRQYLEALEIDPASVDLDQPNRLLVPRLEARGIPFVDTTPALRAAQAAGRGPLYGRVDTHLSPNGHAVVAEAVLPVLIDLVAKHEAPSQDDSP